MTDRTQTATTESLVGEVIGSRFVIDEYVSGGSFGSFHFGHDSHSKYRVGIKLEKVDMDKPQLHLEYGFYKALGSTASSSMRFMPKVFYLGPTADGVWHALVMDLLGPSLLQMHRKCEDRFSLMTTTQLMIQFLNMFEYVHDRGILYRDIKPENFLVGIPNSDHWWTVNLIDLGFCKKYVEDIINVHMPFAKHRPTKGTVRYISVANHSGYETSRRDDLEAILYMIIFLYKGRLPWQGLQTENIAQKEWYRQIGHMKWSLKPEELCSDMPHPFADFRQYVKQLTFEERPDYRHWIAKFRVALLQLGTTMEDMVYDWDEAHNFVRDKNPGAAVIPQATTTTIAGTSPTYTV